MSVICAALYQLDCAIIPGLIGVAFSSTATRLFVHDEVSGLETLRKGDCFAPDGRRFIMIKETENSLNASARDELTVVLNWFEGLRQLAPAGK